MARTVIPTNFQDDELAEEMQGKRRYRQILNTDGTVSFKDETDYDTEGSTFGASRVNEMAQNINESADVNKIIDDLEDISVVTQNGFIAGAKAVKELNNNLGNCIFSVDENGAYVTYTPIGGADSVTKKLGKPEVISKNYTANVSVPRGSVYRNITQKVNVHKDGYIPIGGGITSTKLSTDEGASIPTTIYTLTKEIATVGVGCAYNKEDGSSSSGTINFTIFYIAE